MNKKLLLLGFFTALTITSCADDESDIATCQECTILEELTTYCDNGDGTIEVTIEGVTTTENLNGVSFNTFIRAANAAGGNCKDQ